MNISNAITNNLINKKVEGMNNFNDIINKKIEDEIYEKLKDTDFNEIINKLQDNFDNSLRRINISNELGEKR